MKALTFLGAVTQNPGGGDPSRPGATGRVGFDRVPPAFISGFERPVTRALAAKTDSPQALRNLALQPTTLMIGSESDSPFGAGTRPTTALHGMRPPEVDPPDPSAQPVASAVVAMCRGLVDRFSKELSTYLPLMKDLPPPSREQGRARAAELMARLAAHAQSSANPKATLKAFRESMGELAQPLMLRAAADDEASAEEASEVKKMYYGVARALYKGAELSVADAKLLVCSLEEVVEQLDPYGGDPSTSGYYRMILGMLMPVPMIKAPPEMSQDNFDAAYDSWLHGLMNGNS
jgi:hypothetical protein